MMTEAFDATNCAMMEVGRTISSIMKVCGATSRMMDELIVGEHQVDGTGF